MPTKVPTTLELLDVERVDVLRAGHTVRTECHGQPASRVYRNPFHYQGTDIRMGTSVKINLPVVGIALPKDKPQDGITP